MKFKKLLLTICCISVFNAVGQSYTFNATTASYSNLASSTSLNGTATWDDPSYAIPIGFNFEYFGEALSTIYLSDLGVGGLLADSPEDFGVISILEVYGADIIDRGYDFNVDESPTGSLSSISYELEGSEGNRILKIEWNNVGFFEDVLINGSSNTNATNFQLWLFEVDHSFEIHFGPNTITDLDLAFDGETGTNISLVEAINLDNETLGENGAYVLFGSPTNPTFSNVSTIDGIIDSVMDGVIPNGTVYRFTPIPLSVNEFEISELTLFPNPASNILNITGLKQKEAYRIYDYTGRFITKGTFDVDATLNTENLPSGLYLIQFKNSGALKFIKK